MVEYKVIQEIYNPLFNINHKFLGLPESRIMDLSKLIGEKIKKEKNKDKKEIIFEILQEEEPKLLNKLKLVIGEKEDYI
jgi:hypothetical protein